MAARVAGVKHVVITEQKDLLELMHRNINSNMDSLSMEPERSDPTRNGIFARELSWGVEETQRYLQKYPDEKIDIIFSCDCIYEPLYGQSWKALAQTMEILCIESEKRCFDTNGGSQRKKCGVIMAVERRKQDGIDKFLDFVDTQTKLCWELRETSTGERGDVELKLYYLQLDH
jgi:hypothetical protein